MTPQQQLNIIWDYLEKADREMTADDASLHIDDFIIATVALLLILVTERRAQIET